MTSDEKPGTVSVRIPVVVCECGKWCRMARADDGPIMARHVLPCRCSSAAQLRQFTITAQLPIPDPFGVTAIPGEVSQ
jgi:hypothetical protein